MALRVQKVSGAFKKRTGGAKVSWPRIRWRRPQQEKQIVPSY